MEAYARQSYVFDVDSDLKEKQHEWSVTDQANLSGFSHLFNQDASGKVIKAFASSVAWQFSPDLHSENYGDSNALDQYGSVDFGDGSGAQSFSYDGSGNLTSDGAGRTYTYNSENQMIRAVGTGLDMEYRYDALGRRSHSIDHVGDVEKFHKHIGQMEVGDYKVTRAGGALGTGRVTNYALLTRNVIGAGVDQRLAFYELSNGDELTFPLTNHQGSTIALVTDEGERKPDADGGRFVYGPYGQEVSGATDAGYPYRYTGRRLDVQTGLYYYRARYYDAKTGRFLQTDPIGTADQMNLYGYVGNDPANGTDPSGMESVVVSGNDTQAHNPEHHPENAAERAITMRQSDPNTTWLVLDVGPDPYRESVNVEADRATEAGVNVIRITTADQASNYINTKTTDGASNSRSTDLITNFSYVGHGRSWGGTGRAALLIHQNAVGTFDGTLVSGQFRPASFSNNANINLAASCNTDFIAGALSIHMPSSTVIGRLGDADFYTQGVDTDFDLGNPGRVPDWSDYTHSKSTVTTYRNGTSQ